MKTLGLVVRYRSRGARASSHSGRDQAGPAAEQISAFVWIPQFTHVGHVLGTVIRIRRMTKTEIDRQNYMPDTDRQTAPAGPYDGTEKTAVQDFAQVLSVTV